MSPIFTVWFESHPIVFCPVSLPCQVKSSQVLPCERSLFFSSRYGSSPTRLCVLEVATIDPLDLFHRMIV